MKMPDFKNSPRSFREQAINILILHDSLTAVEAIAMFLMEAGLKVNWHQVATETDYCHWLSPQLDLILYHANCTQLTLTKVMSVLSRNDLKIPLLVINGEASIPQAVTAIKIGATDYLSSVELERLPTAITQALVQPNICSHLSTCTAQSEQQLQQLIIDNADGIIVVDEQGIIQFINPAAVQLLNKPITELIGESLGFPVVNGDYLEVDIPQSPEQILVAQMRLSQIKWQGTNAYIVSLRDITKIKQAEEERAKLLEEAQAANRAKDEFLAILSHELRTPLNPIVGWSQLLQSGSLSEAQMQKGIEIIQRNAMLQAQLIEDILDISRIIRGKLKLKALPVNLNTIIKNALDTVNLAAQAKSIQVETNIEEKSVTVQGDATRLQQVIWNLLSNAIKFTPNGGRVEVSLTFNNNTVQVQIKDTGKGIEPKFLPYVFDYFRQAESAKTRANGGLGLGLAIVRHLVELHGGSICASSPGLGKGATFTVSLPVFETDNQSEPNKNVTSSLKNFAGIKILVVDDDDGSRELLVFLLENEGAEVQAVTSASEALTLIKQFQPDILVSDIGMPHIDGYELMRRVRQLSHIKGKKLKAIAISAYASDLDCQKSLAAGFDCHINKPLDVTNLIQVITGLINSRRH